MREAQMEAIAAHRAKMEHGVLSLKMTPEGETGVDDRMFLLPEKPLLIEFKMPGEERRPKQNYWHDIFKSLSYDTITCWSVDQALSAIRDRLHARGY